MRLMAVNYERDHHPGATNKIASKAKASAYGFDNFIAPFT